MSCLGLSGVVSLLRVTLALPVRVATLPIGSSTAGWAWAAGAAALGVAGAGAAGAAGCAGAGCACANCVMPGAAKTSVAPIQQTMSRSANENQRRITTDSGQRVIGRRAEGYISLAGLNAG